ncbi:MAG: 4-hydroxy-2-oxoheptanedioate aldolase [Pseudomonadota bacterium]
MKAPENSFKRLLQQDRCLYGLWLSLADAYCAEISASAGFDWLLIDGEHAPNDIRSILAQLQAIASYDSHPIVRPVEGDVALIKQLLDIGAQTLLIPMVESAEQAQALVRATQYPPQGNRGVGAALGRASRWNKAASYHCEAEEHLCLLLQVESREGLDNLDAILAVEGYDGIFLGPADLAASVGHIGESGHPDVQSLIADALKRIRAAGKAAGILTTDKNLADVYISHGANFVGVGVDVLALTQGTAEILKQYQ